MKDFPVGGCLRLIRRRGDLSQRELADKLQVSKSSIAAIESGTRPIDVSLLARAAALAGVRLALLDADGREISPLAENTVRDLSGRRFPAHLDTERSDERGWIYDPRPDRPETSFTFTRDRSSRDFRRRAQGTPEDHHERRAGDTPWERAEARRRAALAAQVAERERAFLAGELRTNDQDFECSCPPRCDELDDRSGKPVHADECPCGCDVA